MRTPQNTKLRQKLSAVMLTLPLTFSAVAYADGPTAATVNGTAISKARVDLVIKQKVEKGKKDSPDLRKAVLEQLTMQILVSEEAQKNGLANLREVQDQLALTKQSILANAFVQDYIKTHPVSDDTLKVEYDKIKAQMQGLEYKARHILVGSEAEASGIIAQLKNNPNDFDTLAKAQSKDPGSRDKGGELGWFDPRGMVPEFGAAVTKLGKGKMTDEPVKTQFGYHVILLEDSRPMQIPPLDQVKPQLTKKVQQQQLETLIDDMKVKAKLTIAAPGSLIVATANGTPISKERIDLLVKQRMGMGQSDTPELRKAIIEQLAMQLIVSQEAVKKGLDKNPEVVDQTELSRNTTQVTDST